MNPIRFGTQLLIDPRINDKTIQPDLKKILKAVNEQFPADHVVVNVLSGGEKSNPSAPKLQSEFFELYIQSPSGEPVRSAPMRTVEFALPDGFLAISRFIGNAVAKLNGGALDLRKFAESLSRPQS